MNSLLPYIDTYTAQWVHCPIDSYLMAKLQVFIFGIWMEWW